MVGMMSQRMATLLSHKINMYDYYIDFNGQIVQMRLFSVKCLNSQLFLSKHAQDTDSTDTLLCEINMLHK